MWQEIRRLNKEVARQATEIGKLDTRLENCLMANTQAAKRQAANDREHEILITTKLDKNQSLDPDE